MFIEDSLSIKQSNDLITIISDHLHSKELLLTAFIRRANFPEYFGMNWDAFDECLHDLSWLNNQRLVIAHKTLPLSDSECDLKIYLQILNQTVRDWSFIDSNRIIITFALHTYPTVLSLMN